MANNIGIIIEREYMQRVRKKSFIFTTLLLPVVMLLFSLLPALIMIFAGSDETNVLVVDETPQCISAQLKGSDDLHFIPSEGISRDSAMRRQDVSGVLIIPANATTSKSPQIRYYSNGPVSIVTEGEMRGRLNDILSAERLNNYDIPGLQQIIDDSKVDIAFSAVRLDKDEPEEATSSMVSYMLGLGLSFILYMFVLIYGQMVMNSIIEEKSNRVLEVVVSSIRPTQLMLGKILGVAAVALTQIVIWCVVAVVISSVVIPAVIPADIMADAQALKAGAPTTTGTDADLLNMLSVVTSAGAIGSMIVNMLIITAYLLLGFLLYASIFAAIGSAVDNLQDASNLSSWAVMPIVLGIMFALLAASNPTGTVSFWTSIIPLTSPMVMVARIPFGIPSWEIWLSLVLLVAGFLGIAWVAGKIYRVGIFMYGKKPSVKDLVKWMRYK